ncbi:MAG: lipocalin-like domain-containing protein [Bacteroidota bacterium]
MIRRRSHRFWMVVALLSGALMASACSDREPAADDGLDVAEALSGDTAGFDRATGPREFRFPADHGPHPDFRTEWWYYTGNVRTDDGRRFGYQFTVFRTALRPEATSREEGTWSTNQLYMAHFAVSDVASDRFYFEERFSREAAGLAGARGAPYRVWLDDWEAEAIDGSFGRQVIRAESDDVELVLELEAVKPIVLHGDAGFDRKGEGYGNASYYYALTRWRTAGTIRTGETTHRVEGTSWLDREWSTSVLGEGIQGWDWFALQLEDGRDLMFYQLRGEDDEPVLIKGAVIAEDGLRRGLVAEDIVFEVLDQWRSPRGGIYPSGWQLDVPSEGLSVRITPVKRDQELDVSIRYWEGAVDVTGLSGERPVAGSGYAELTGYARGGPNRFLRQ